MSAAADKLRKARKLIERGWTQQAYARGKSGRQVDAESRYATCFCASGALWRAFRPHEPAETELSARDALKTAIGCGSIPRWNDAPERTQTDVLAAFDKAIELAEQSA